MSETGPAYIEIGGRLEERNVPILWNAIEGDSACVDYDERVEDMELTRTAKGLLSLVNPTTKYLTFRDSEAVNGYYAEIESACKELGLAFDRHSDALGGYSPEIVKCRSGKCRTFMSNNDGDTLLLGAPIVAAYKRLLDGQIDQALTLLSQSVADWMDTAELPPFEIT